MNDIIIKIENVWASYNSKSTVLQEINIDIKKSSNYAILGVSGSGKSTLLKLINGMMSPHKGRVAVEGQTPNQKNPKFRVMMSHIGYIPQHLGLVRNSTVMDNVMIGALPRMRTINSLLKRYPNSEVEAAYDILERVGLEGKEKRKAYMLSGGEKRRVAIARAFMQQPTILLADEMLSELDGRTAREVMDIVADAQKSTGLTAVMVHHDVKLALEFADRVALIQRGSKVMEIGVKDDEIVDFQTVDMKELERTYGT